VPNYGHLREKRVGVMLHYDASAGDVGAVAWLTRDPRCEVSYNRLILDDGLNVKVAPDDARAWHAGVCKPSSNVPRYVDANSAFYGISIAAKKGDTITPLQFDAVVLQVKLWFEEEGWSLTETHRITSHHLEAWPRGRKVDIQGVNGYDLVNVQAAVSGRSDESNKGSQVLDDRYRGDRPLDDDCLRRVVPSWSGRG